MESDLNNWLEKLGLGKYADVFAENDVDFEVLPELTEPDLRELGLSLGHRRKLLAAIKDLIGETPANTETTNKAIQSPEHGDAERRQLTVMFVDMVGQIGSFDKTAGAYLGQRDKRHQGPVADENSHAADDQAARS